MQKQCTKCLELKELSEFNKDKYAKDGFTTRCKRCRRAAFKKYSQSDQGKAKIKDYAQSEQCKEFKRKNDKKYTEQGKKKTYARKWRQTESGKASCRKKHEKRKESGKLAEYTKVYIKRDHIKKRYSARDAVYRATKTGKLIRPDECSQCGRTGTQIQGHHHSYEKEYWLDIEWLCSECHDDIHRDKEDIQC